MTKRNLGKRGALGLLGVAAAAVGGVFLYRKVKGAQLPPGASTKPPAVRPGEVVPDIVFTQGGESYLTLPPGSEFRVVWDPSSPWNYNVQETTATEAVEFGDGWAKFRQVVALPSDGVSQVFVIATDENSNVIAEHKVTVFGP